MSSNSLSLSKKVSSYKINEEDNFIIAQMLVDLEE
jgi:hypothetical protein